jgi:hypothetical protein
VAVPDAVDEGGGGGAVGEGEEGHLRVSGAGEGRARRSLGSRGGAGVPTDRSTYTSNEGGGTRLIGCRPAVSQLSSWDRPSRRMTMGSPNESDFGNAAADVVREQEYGSGGGRSAVSVPLPEEMPGARVERGATAGVSGDVGPAE